MNQVKLDGHLGRSPEMFYTKDGKACTKFSLAVDKVISGVKQEPDWFNVTCWGEVAELVTQYLKKGSYVKLNGSVRVSKYKSKKLVEGMVALNVPKDKAEDLAVATWYEISAYGVESPEFPFEKNDDIPLFDMEEGHF